MDGSTSFGEWLKQRRTRLHLSREQLAQRVGCAAITLRKIEADQRRPSVELAERLAVVLDVPPAAQPTFVGVARDGLPLDSLSPAAPGHIPAPPAAIRVASTLPRGTVTFLFADIADNPQLWAQYPLAMHDLLSHYTAILQEAIAEEGGSIFQMSGDGVSAAFANPLDAITAALAAQRALAAQSWEAIGPLPVRMALHTGVVAEPTGAYVGGPASWGMLLLAASHGRQILLSQVTQELLRDQLPASVALRDLGTYCLGDSSSPEHLFQLIVPDLPAAFPPLRSPARRPHNLPMPPTPLIGREQDVAAVVATLRREEARLITLTGPGGVGKTRLSVQVAAELRDAPSTRSGQAFAHGVFLVDLSALHDPAFVVPAIAHTLGVTEVDDQPLLARLRDYVATKHLLLLLDNFEQVLPAAAALAALMAAAPRLKLLVTSRAALHLAGEHEFPVAPLPWKDDAGHAHDAGIEAPDSSSFILHRASFPPAVALFVQRAQAVKPDFAVTPETAALVEQICQRLDGLPLAIELAAARIKLFPLAALLQRLDHRLALLTGGARDLPARHQTLRAAIEWSYQLLENQAQTLLQRLAVFVGGFTLEAAETICGDQDLKLEDGGWRIDLPSSILHPPSSILDGLAVLVDQSLVRPLDDSSGVPRFTMLDTIREYALMHLERSGDEPALRQRHTAYFLRLAEQIEPELQGSDMRTWLDRLEVEHANLRAALSWALGQGAIELAARLASALTAFWDVRHRREGRDWLEAVLTSGTSLTPAIRAKTLHAAGWLARAQYDQAVATAWLEESLALYREVGDERGRTATMTDLGWTLATFGGDMTRATAHLEEGLARYRALGDQQGIARALQGLGWVEQHRVLGDKRGIAWSLAGLGWVEQHRGSLAKARALHVESLALARAARDAQAIAWALSSLGTTAAAQRDYAAARAFEEERLAIERSQNNRHGIASALRMLGVIALRQGAAAAARTWLVESLALARAIGDTLTIAFALAGLAEVAHVAGDHGQAMALLHEALAHFRELGDQHRMAQVYALLAQVALDKQDDATAQSMALQSLQLARSVDDTLAISACLAGLADSAARRGQAVWAARLWGAAECQGEDPKAHRAPVEPPNRPQLMDTVRTSLGEAAFAAAWAAGRALTPEEVLGAQDTVDAGLAPASAGTASRHAAPGSPRPAGLTQREFEVLLLVAEGLSNTQIAERLVISVATVKTYLSAIYDKLGVASRTAAMRYVIDHRLE